MTSKICDRTWLPKNEDDRSLAEKEIKNLGLDKGLAKPSTLTTKVAEDFQRVLDSDPDVSHCLNKAALDLWK